MHGGGFPLHTCFTFHLWALDGRWEVGVGEGTRKELMVMELDRFCSKNHFDNASNGGRRCTCGGGGDGTRAARPWRAAARPAAAATRRRQLARCEYTRTPSSCVLACLHIAAIAPFPPPPATLRALHVADCATAPGAVLPCPTMQAYARWRAHSQCMNMLLQRPFVAQKQCPAALPPASPPALSILPCRSMPCSIARI